MVDGPSAPVGYDGLVRPVAAGAGGLAVPKSTLNVVPIAPADQPSVAGAPTPTAPFDGVGVDGAAGGPAVPAVAKDWIGDGAIMDGLIGVAKVRDTTFQ